MNQKSRDMAPFVWQPGTGVDASALARLRSHCTGPKEPMGEAWFMGDDRRMFHELQGDLNALPVEVLQEALEEIVSGIGAFGPRAEWTAWYSYLLGQLVPRAHEAFTRPLVELLVSGFVAIHPNGVHAPPYPGFADDALQTLGQCLMNPACWDGTEVIEGGMLHRDQNHHGLWGWWDASGDFSASMCFCLKYLRAEQIPAWLHSALLISSPHWRAQVLVWLVGAHDLLTGRVNWPSEWSERARPSVDWQGSHCLRAALATQDDSGAAPLPSLLPEAVKAQTLALVRAHFTEEVFVDWLLAFSRVPSMEAELAEIPSGFEQLYVGHV